MFVFSRIYIIHSLNNKRGFENLRSLHNRFVVSSIIINIVERIQNIAVTFISLAPTECVSLLGVDDEEADDDDHEDEEDSQTKNNIANSVDSEKYLRFKACLQASERRSDQNINIIDILLPSRYFTPLKLRVTLAWELGSRKQ